MLQLVCFCTRVICNYGNPTEFLPTGVTAICTCCFPKVFWHQGDLQLWKSIRISTFFEPHVFAIMPTHDANFPPPRPRYHFLHFPPNPEHLMATNPQLQFAPPINPFGAIFYIKLTHEGVPPLLSDIFVDFQRIEI